MHDLVCCTWLHTCACIHMHSHCTDHWIHAAITTPLPSILPILIWTYELAHPHLWFPHPFALLPPHSHTFALHTFSYNSQWPITLLHVSIDDIILNQLCHPSQDLHKGVEIQAANGKKMLALKVFSHALRFFKDHCLQELSDQSSTRIVNDDIRWVITVPAIWRQPAKQFMRQASYEVRAMLVATINKEIFIFVLT